MSARRLATLLGLAATLAAGMLIGAVVGGPGAAVGQSGVDPGEEADDAPPPAAPADDDVRTVLLIGDSLAYQVGPELEALLTDPAVEVVVHATPGEGIVNAPQDWMLDWIDDVARLVDRHEPDVVVAEFVGNYDTANAVDDTGRTIEPRTDRFYAEWLARAVDLAQVVVDAGAELHWVIPPAMDSPVDPGLAAHTQRIAEVYRTELVAAVPGIELLDWFTLFDGRWDLRAADGVHFTTEGARRAATSIAELVGAS